MLGRVGREGLKVAHLCKSLDVTTGSFYWHFKNTDQFFRALPEYWVAVFIPALGACANARAKTPDAVLEELGKVLLETQAYRVDAAMRRWAARVPEMNKHVRKADEFRRTFIIEAARARGEGKSLSEEQLLLLGMAWLGSSEMQDQKQRFKAIGLITQMGLGANGNST